MIDLLIILLLNAFLIAGIHLATYDEMILVWLHYIGLPSWLEKPLFDCPTCMASVHGTYVYLLALSYINLPLWGLVLYIPVLAGISTLVWRVIESFEKHIYDDWSDNIRRN